MATNTADSSAARERYRKDPVAFTTEVLRNPETGKAFELYFIQARFLREAFTLLADGTLQCSELVYSCPKKSGKTATAAIAMIYVIVVLGGQFAEGYCCANDMEQSKGRVFQAIARIVEASPLLRNSATITLSKITFTSTGSTITALASDAAGAAGSNPTFICFDELWAYTSEASRRLWDEMVPVPTRKVSARLTVTYAGFEGESSLLEDLYARGMKGKEIAPALRKQKGMLMLWSHKPVAPWQTKSWLSQMREQHRRNAYLRQIENRWVSTESSFVDLDWYDACVDSSARPIVASQSLPVWVGVDASVKHDSTAIVACTYDSDQKKVRLVAHRIFVPTRSENIDFESMIEKTVMELRERFRVRAVYFDPYQMQASAQRLRRAGINMIEYPQTVPNLTECSSNLYDLIKAQNLIVYKDADIRMAISRSVALETPRGFRITKEKASARIDVVIALAMSALGAVQGQHSEPSAITLLKLENARVQVARGVAVEQAAISVGVSQDQLARFVERNAASAQASASVGPTPQNAEAFEYARKLCDNGMTAEQACAEAFKIHRVSIDAEALRAYHLRSITPTALSRPLFAPAGSKRLENL